MSKPDITYKVDLRGMKAFFDAGNKISDIKKPIREYVTWLERETREQFAKESDPEGKRWADLKPSTWLRKKTRAIGRESSQGVNSVFSKVSGGKNYIEGIVGVGAEYLYFFHKGTRFMEPRPILGMTQERERKGEAILEKHIDNATRGA